MKKLFDSYTIIARIFPSIITALPLIILWFYIRNISGLDDLVKYLNDIKYLGDIGIITVSIYLFALIIRQISLKYQDQYFENSGFPTTYFLLFQNTEYTDEFKQQFRKKVKKLLNVNLPTKKMEKDDISKTKMRINEAIQQVIVVVGEKYLVKKHNIWYGFFRNLIGGTIIAILLSIVNIIIGILIIQNYQIIFVSIFLAVGFIVIYLFRKTLIIKSAEDYAKKLIAEFISH